MDRKETLDKIKETLKSLMTFSSEIKEKSFGSFDLTDGTKISSPSTDLEIGSEVYAIDDQGNQTPLEDGEYVLTDGRTITIKGNKIENISSSDSEEESETPEEESSEPTEQEQKMEDGLPQEHPSEAGEAEQNDVSSRLSDIEKQIEDILNIINKLGTTQGEVNEQMMSKLDSISNENGGKPIKTAKREFTTDYTPGKSDFANELKDFLKERKNKK